MATTVAEYIAGQPKAMRPLLKRVRAAIRAAVPGGKDVISYRIAAYRLPSGIVLYYAGWKAHYSIYPATKALVRAFRKDLAPYEVNERGTIRFPLDEPVPATLIGRIAAYRAAELEAKA